MEEGIREVYNGLSLVTFLIVRETMAKTSRIPQKSILPLFLSNKDSFFFFEGEGVHCCPEKDYTPWAPPATIVVLLSSLAKEM